MTSESTQQLVEVDCIIAGAGPVGLLSALFLAREGWRVMVFERWPSRYPMPRACTIDHEALRILQAAGVMAEHSDLFEPSLGAHGGYQIRDAQGRLLRAINWNRAAESGWANTNGFYQPDLEEVLETMATGLPSVEIRRGWTVTDLTQTHDVVSVTVEPTDEGGPSQTVKAPWVIAADGANSSIRELLGIASTDSGFEADWLVADYQPLVDRDWSAFVTQYCDPRQPATAVASGPGRRRFEFMRMPDMTSEELGRPETAWRLMAPWGITPENARLERHAVYTFRGRWAEDWRRGRVLLAGDAAHLMPPFLGQGLCAGLRDARALTWRLSLLSRGLADDVILDSYVSERREHVHEIIEEAVAVGRVICESDPVRAAKRDEQLLADVAAGGDTVEPPHPRLGRPSMTFGDADAAGRLAVQGRVAVADREGLFDDVIGGTWQLIGLEVDPTSFLDQGALQWLQELGGTITNLSSEGAVVDVDGTYQRWFAEHGCEVVLSRPDFYVYFAGSATELPNVVKMLQAQLTTARAMKEI